VQKTAAWKTARIVGESIDDKPKSPKLLYNFYFYWEIGNRERSEEGEFISWIFPLSSCIFIARSTPILPTHFFPPLPCSL
jgi:hypothetical protein